MIISAQISLVIFFFIQNVYASMYDAHIIAVSTINGQENSKPQGSMMGGTILYMKIKGLDSTISNLAVYIDIYPCIIQENDVNWSFITCKTTQPDLNDLTKLTNLIIYVSVDDTYFFCTFSKTYCYFTYPNSLTPYLFYVSPRSNYPNGISYWWMQWKLTPMVKNLDQQYIGTYSCDRYQVQGYVPGVINPNDAIVPCQVSMEIEAGYYEYKAQSQYGYVKHDIAVAQKKVYDDSLYQSKIIPIITSMSTNYASPQGLILQINGYGFSSDIKNNVVKISGQPENVQIEILKSSPTTILSIYSFQARILKPTWLPKLTDLTNQMIYIQGSGLLYTRYDLKGSNIGAVGLRTQIITDPTKLTVKFDGIYPEIDVQNTFGEYYGQYFRGYLLAPLTGIYKFYLVADNGANFYIQLNQFSTTRPTTAVVISDWKPYKNFWQEYFNPPMSAIKSISETISLTQGEYYYIELYHVNGDGPGYLKLSMVVENNSGQRKANSLTSLWSISTSYTPQKEVIEFTVYNSDGNTKLSGTYKLQFTYGTQTTPQTYAYYNYITSDLSMTSSIAAIENAIEACGGGYLVSVTATKLDNTGAPLEDVSITFAGYKYTITFDSYRGETQYRAIPKLISSLTGGTLVSNIVRTIEPKDPISGTFQLTMRFNEQDYLFEVSASKYDLPFDSSSQLFVDNIQRITGDKPIVWVHGRAQDGCTWRINFRTYIPGLSITGDDSKLISGDGPVTLKVEETASDDLLFEPIPNELLFTYSHTPQVQVYTNGILSGCQQSKICDITLSDTRTPTLKSFSVAGSVLSLTLQSGEDQPNIKPADLTIDYLGADCSNIQFTNAQSPYQITCNLEQLNGLNIQEAGLNQVPQVHDANIGYSLVDASVTETNINLSISSVSPSSASPDGGTKLVINGSGFPKNINRKFTLSIGGTEVVPVSISNQQIIVISPAVNTGEIVLNFNGQSVIELSRFTIDASKKS